MSPVTIVQSAVNRGLDLIAVTDHNTAQNASAVINAAEGTPLKVIPGMEITSREEVHIIALYPSLEAALAVQECIHDTLDPCPDNAVVNDQVLANEFDEVEGFCSHLLLGATSFGVKQVVNMVHEEGGLAIAAHIDRQAFGILGQLGFIPPRVPLDALEVSPRVSLTDVRTRYADYAHYPFITSSDAHNPEDIGRVRTKFEMAEASFDELSMAVKGEDGRRILETTA